MNLECLGTCQLAWIVKWTSTMDFAFPMAVGTICQLCLAFLVSFLSSSSACICSLEIRLHTIRFFHERASVFVAQLAPQFTQPFAHFGVVHFRQNGFHLSTLSLRPDHEAIHWTLYTIWSAPTLCRICIRTDDDIISSDSLTAIHQSSLSTIVVILKDDMHVNRVERTPLQQSVKRFIAYCQQQYCNVKYWENGVPEMSNDEIELNYEFA
ncbi:hypothetical protein T4B_14200 [Trichinella pseudospiralis]|uniref:Uncharacterized protein n=1 Tax=Trichinella pseudospiralis TaxID=6337 RepID=A0A0V1EFB0_TRIPS|nr:hypothetical protein T4A_10433 [Trichinella pseudospiralis]KRZ24551.1 hypothetical protein T4B_14200 [Trichinella pseudospiralis]KRZ31056.1 hypothetical protein T4C_2895 [Trichinella pseudospiralis]